jgi:hypothetical protein
MPIYGFDLTIVDSDFSEEQANSAAHVAREAFRGDGEATVERWNVGHDDFIRVLSTVHAANLTQALERIIEMAREGREAVGLADGQVAGVSIAVRDLSKPVERTLPPVFTPRRLESTQRP